MYMFIIFIITTINSLAFVLSLLVSSSSLLVILLLLLSLLSLLLVVVVVVVVIPYDSRYRRLINDLRNILVTMGTFTNCPATPAPEATCMEKSILLVSRRVEKVKSPKLKMYAMSRSGFDVDRLSAVLRSHSKQPPLPHTTWLLGGYSFSSQHTP